MVKGSDRLRYLAYRCHRCGRILTKLEILDRWHEAEKDVSVTKSAVCPCGARHLSPSNVKLWEELFLPRVWKLWWYEVFLPWVRR